ncbi:MAG TPA: DUF2252 family protein [Thermoanaerobaculia bacterium]|nr:DUF2252 family protein [Thermoanaerobaculia bacterium]
MTIQQATKSYESWLGEQLFLIRADLDLKHQRMSQAAFPFLRATYYRWAQIFPEVCSDLAGAPEVLAVGDLHIENFGTWRDAEGRLVWGINDFDETCRLPYVHDLVRVATSAHLAVESSQLVRISAKEADEAILRGYQAALEAGGKALVLAERWKALRHMAVHRLADPGDFWHKMESIPKLKGDVPPKAVQALSEMLPRPDLPRRIVHRVAGLGSLGRQRFVALAEWQGGRIAREAKALAPSAAVWAHGGEGETKILYQMIVDKAIRSVDPWVKLRRRWMVRRLAPDCTRIELHELPKERDEIRLLEAMGWETANIHLGSRTAHALLVDLASRESGWLHRAAWQMLEAVKEDWNAWRERPVPESLPAAKPKKKGEERVVNKKAARQGLSAGAQPARRSGGVRHFPELEAGESASLAKAKSSKTKTRTADTAAKPEKVKAKEKAGKAKAGPKTKAKPDKAKAKAAKAKAKPRKVKAKAGRVRAKAGRVKAKAGGAKPKPEKARARAGRAKAVKARAKAGRAKAKPASVEAMRAEAAGGQANRAAAERAPRAERPRKAKRSSSAERLRKSERSPRSGRSAEAERSLEEARPVEPVAEPRPVEQATAAPALAPLATPEVGDASAVGSGAAGAAEPAVAAGGAAAGAGGAEAGAAAGAGGPAGAGAAAREPWEAESGAGAAAPGAPPGGGAAEPPATAGETSAAAGASAAKDAQ